MCMKVMCHEKGKGESNGEYYKGRYLIDIFYHLVDLLEGRK